MILIGRGLDLAQVLKKRSIGRKERSVGESFHVQLSGCGKAAKSARLSKRSKQSEAIKATQASEASKRSKAAQRAEEAERSAAWHQTSSQFPVVMTRGSHLFPSRTQKLSLSVPMVLGWTRPGRVGRCRIPHGKLERASLFSLGECFVDNSFHPSDAFPQHGRIMMRRRCRHHRKNHERS